MNSRLKKIVKTEIADMLVWFVGGAVALILGACKVTPSENYLGSMGILTVIELCLFCLIFTVELISVFKISDSTWHTLFIALSLLGYHVTGVDMTYFIGTFGAHWYVKIADALNFMFFGLSLAAILAFWNYTYSVGLGKRTVVYVVLAIAASCGLYVGMDFFRLGIIAYCLLLIFLAPLGVAMYKRIYEAHKIDMMFAATKLVLFSVAGAALTTNACAAFGFYANGFPTLQELPIIIIFITVYALFVMRTDREALKASEYKLQYERVKSQALREQIKPHFIFNTLAAIQSLYRENLDEGDMAINLFSRHLRTNIEASNTDFIPFEMELDNIQVYIDLENMRLTKPIDVIFDIDFTDFSVPILSLQPYIENAIKHSRINEKEDGFIRISSQLTDEGIELEIADNGVGFDMNAIPPSSCGIRNSGERFYLLMGVTPEIISAPDMGTTVKIKFACDNRAAFGHKRENNPDGRVQNEDNNS